MGEDQTAKNDFETSADRTPEAWYDRYFKALGSTSPHFESEFMGGFNGFERIMHGYDRTLTVNAFESILDRPESFIIFVAKTGHVTDDYRGNPATDSYVDLCLSVARGDSGNEVVAIHSATGDFEAIADLNGQDPYSVVESVGKILREEYPAMDMDSPAARNLFQGY